MTDEQTQGLQDQAIQDTSTGNQATQTESEVKQEEVKVAKKAKTTKAKATKKAVNIDTQLRSRATIATGYRAYYHNLMKSVGKNK